MSDTTPTTDLVIAYRLACATYDAAVEAVVAAERGVRAATASLDEAIDTLPRARRDKEQTEAAVLARVRGETEEAS